MVRYPIFRIEHFICNLITLNRQFVLLVAEILLIVGLPFIWLVERGSHVGL